MSDSASALPEAPIAHPDPKLYFKVRRETMWRTQITMVVFTLLFIVCELYKSGFVSGFSSVITGFYSVFAMPTLGYYGNTAISEFYKRK